MKVESGRRTWKVKASNCHLWQHDKRLLALRSDATPCSKMCVGISFLCITITIPPYNIAVSSLFDKTILYRTAQSKYRWCVQYIITCSSCRLVCVCNHTHYYPQEFARAFTRISVFGDAAWRTLGQLNNTSWVYQQLGSLFFHLFVQWQHQWIVSMSA